MEMICGFFFSSRRRHTRLQGDWSSDVCSSDLKDDDEVLRHLARAEQLGCVAVGMDIDVVFLEKAWDEVPGPAVLGHKTLEDLRRFRAATRLPFLLKGVLSAHDARL